MSKEETKFKTYNILVDGQNKLSRNLRRQAQEYARDLISDKLLTLSKDKYYYELLVEELLYFDDAIIVFTVFNYSNVLVLKNVDRAYVNFNTTKNCLMMITDYVHRRTEIPYLIIYHYAHLIFKPFNNKTRILKLV